MERNQPRSLACVPWPRLDLSLLKIHYSWFSALSGPRLQPYLNGVINAVVFEQYLPFCAGLYFWSPENQPPDGTRCGKLGQNPNFFWKHDHLRINVAPVINQSILGLQIFLDHRSLSSIVQKILMILPPPPPFLILVVHWRLFECSLSSVHRLFLS